MSRTSEYLIELGIDKQDKAHQKLKQMERGFKAISDAAKQAGNGMNFQENFEQMEAQANALTAQIMTIAHDSKGEFSEAFKAYQQNASKAMAVLQNQSDKLTFSLSDEGKAYREQIKALREKTELTKEEKKELSDLSKMVVELSDEEINSAIKRNKLMRVNIKAAEAQAKYDSALSENLAQKSFEKIGMVAEKTLITMGDLIAHPIETLRKGADAITGSSFAQKLTPLVNTLGRLPEIAEEWPEKFKDAKVKYKLMIAFTREALKKASLTDIVQKDTKSVCKQIGTCCICSLIFKKGTKNGFANK